MIRQAIAGCPALKSTEFHDGVGRLALLFGELCDLSPHLKLLSGGTDTSRMAELEKNLDVLQVKALTDSFLREANARRSR